jgi:hypothetical protein
MPLTSRSSQLLRNTDLFELTPDVADLLPLELEARFRKVRQEIDTYAKSNPLGYFADEMNQDRLSSEDQNRERTLSNIEATRMMDRDQRRAAPSGSGSPWLGPSAKRRKPHVRHPLADSSHFLDKPLASDLGSRLGGKRAYTSAPPQRRFSSSPRTPSSDQDSTTDESVTVASQEDEVVEIKSDSEVAQHSAIQGLRAAEVVTVHTSRSNRQHVLPLAKLDGSRVLQNWLVAGKTGSYVFHPTLLDVDPHIFARMIQFLIEGEYAPKVIETADASSIVYRLQGVLRSSEAYSKELEKAASLYVLAQQFEMPALCDHIFSKVVSARFGVFDRMSLLRACETIFQRPEYKDGVADSSATPDATKDDAVEDWLISEVAQRYPELVKWCPDEFLKLEQCKCRGFGRRMHQKRGEMVDAPDLVIQLDP